MFKTFLLVGVGSFLGGGLRFVVSKYIQNAVEYSFPLGTLIVNLAGCFIIGLLYALFDRGNLINPDYRLFLTVGFCGGFTTFSTFMNENFQLLKSANFFNFSMYVLLSFIGGFIALYLGHMIIKLL
jgi:CrcB protein